MKNRPLTSLLAAICVLSCTPENVEYLDFDTFKVLSVDSDIIVMPDGNLNPKLQGMQADADETKIASITSAGLLKELIPLVKKNEIVRISGTYTGHDVDGSPLTLSGTIVLPRSGAIKNMVLVSHYTIGANYECPSLSFPMEGIIASRGYAVVFADYIGYGVTSARIHPYMHSESTARSVVDMGLAVKAYLEHVGRAPESREVILMGYSQGGANTLAVMDLIQREYSTELAVKKAYAGGGPYDLAATYDLAVQENISGIPCAIPMIVQGINEGERLGLDMADFFGPNLLARYDEWINSKKYTTGEINRLIGTKELSEIMTRQGLDKTSESTAKFYAKMIKNSTLNFTPESPVFMLHSTTDKTVPFVNAQKAQEYFKDKGADITYDFADYGDHGSGFLQLLFKVTKDLD